MHHLPRIPGRRCVLGTYRRRRWRFCRSWTYTAAVVVSSSKGRFGRLLPQRFAAACVPKTRACGDDFVSRERNFQFSNSLFFSNNREKIRAREHISSSSLLFPRRSKERKALSKTHHRSPKIDFVDPTTLTATTIFAYSRFERRRKTKTKTKTKKQASSKKDDGGVGFQPSAPVPNNALAARG